MVVQSDDDTVPLPLWAVLREDAERLAVLLARLLQVPEARIRDAFRRRLDRVLALLSFLPSGHPLRDCGRRLQRVCDPLLAPQAVLADSRLPGYCLRTLQALLPTPGDALAEELCRRVQSLLHVTAEPQRQQELLKRLGQLAPLSGIPAPDTRPGESALVTLLRWQAVLQRSRRQAPGLQSGRVLRAGLQDLARRIADSTWHLRGYCEDGILDGFTAALTLAKLQGAMGMEGALFRLEAEVLDQHLLAVAPDSSHLRTWLTTLFRLASGERSAEPPPSPLPGLLSPDDPAVRAGLARQLAETRTALGECLAGSADFTGPTRGARLSRLAGLHYRLAWSWQALGEVDRARVHWCLSQVCAHYWQPGLTPSTPLSHLLRALGDPDSLRGTTSAQRRLLTLQILRQWPLVPASAGREIAQQEDLRTLPARMATAFPALLACTPAALEGRGPGAAERDAMIADLKLLERGAAALRAWPLEQLATLLLEAHAAQAEGGIPPPGLLPDAHACLVDLLDCAAAWQEGHLPDTLRMRLQDWLAGLPRAADGPGRTSSAEACTGLQMRLRIFLTQMAAMLDRPARLQVGPTALPATVDCGRIETALKPLLRHILLEQGAGLRDRRARFQPAITSLQLELAGEDSAITVILQDDSPAAVPCHQTLRRLQRELPQDCGGLRCAARDTGCGREFRLTLPG